MACPSVFDLRKIVEITRTCLLHGIMQLKQESLGPLQFKKQGSIGNS